jgi:hypothetical protein
MSYQTPDCVRVPGYKVVLAPAPPSCRDSIPDCQLPCLARLLEVYASDPSRNRDVIADSVPRRLTIVCSMESVARIRGHSSAAVISCVLSVGHGHRMRGRELNLGSIFKEDG